jgi:hypothetical protein
MVRNAARRRTRSPLIGTGTQRKSPIWSRAAMISQITDTGADERHDVHVAGEYVEAGAAQLQDPRRWPR